jgi:ubiquinone/menaquinone biosynthesis C-methylase UbiE
MATYEVASLPERDRAESSAVKTLLDLGCGTGDSWRGLSIDVTGRRIIGIDIQHDRIRAATMKYRSLGWHHICARGEEIPLPNDSIEGAFSGVALPYMHIPRTLAELHRVLVPGGWFRASLHAPRFTVQDLRKCFPKPKASFFRMFVLLNGLCLQTTGNVISLGRIAESCQTVTGMRWALRRAGFDSIMFARDGLRFYVNAVKPPGTGL